ncbi:MAG TPA: hypothetical protein VIV40_38810 [Kofleriaceae bacterium]
MVDSVPNERQAFRAALIELAQLDKSDLGAALRKVLSLLLVQIEA